MWSWRRSAAIVAVTATAVVVSAGAMWLREGTPYDLTPGKAAAPALAGDLPEKLRIAWTRGRLVAGLTDPRRVVIGDGVAVVPDEDHDVVEGVAVATGTTVWKLAFQKDDRLCAHGGDDMTVVLLYGDHSCDHLIALHVGTGRVRWKKTLPGEPYSDAEKSVTVANGRFFLRRSSAVEAYRLDTGVRIWHRDRQDLCPDSLEAAGSFVMLGWGHDCDPITGATHSNELVAATNGQPLTGFPTQNAGGHTLLAADAERAVDLTHSSPDDSPGSEHVNILDATGRKVSTTRIRDVISDAQTRGMIGNRRPIGIVSPTGMYIAVPTSGQYLYRTVALDRTDGKPRWVKPGVVLTAPSTGEVSLHLYHEREDGDSDWEVRIRAARTGAQLRVLRPVASDDVTGNTSQAPRQIGGWLVGYQFGLYYAIGP
ncbi:PQQ-binding-like beta-propeller repeat protein [Actinoallomurus iriomotensis]|uniref:Pyrrolo-quinoline quinone repeat domain-containing protein n=1 Tax=Actinoallomurus iriomotensis TaxID=478107 RepID=A0A9W6RQ90_9ACTN|nr:PQQ-binding-like beta-propeller repeat protein [Actinoallomurus iriomotensis]GLY78137.1 hypothetical protein Airi01_064040 [Actinoallomurus iriomotensis]